MPYNQIRRRCGTSYPQPYKRAALAVADQIASRTDIATIHRGVPTFLGIQTAQVADNGFGQVGNGFDASSGAAVGQGSGASVEGVVTLGSGPAD